MFSSPTSLSNLKMSKEGSSIFLIESSEKFMYLISSRPLSTEESSKFESKLLECRLIFRFSEWELSVPFMLRSLSFVLVEPSFPRIFIVEYSSSHENTVCSSLFSFFSSSNFFIDCSSVLKRIESWISCDSLRRINTLYYLTLKKFKLYFPFSSLFLFAYHLSPFAKVVSFEYVNFSLHNFKSFTMKFVRSKRKELIFFDSDSLLLYFLSFCREEGRLPVSTSNILDISSSVKYSFKLVSDTNTCICSLLFFRSLRKVSIVISKI
jgi:hypothetical protein